MKTTIELRDAIDAFFYSHFKEYRRTQHEYSCKPMVFVNVSVCSDDEDRFVPVEDWMDGKKLTIDQIYSFAKYFYVLGKEGALDKPGIIEHD